MILKKMKNYIKELKEKDYKPYKRRENYPKQYRFFISLEKGLIFLQFSKKLLTLNQKYGNIYTDKTTKKRG